MNGKKAQVATEYLVITGFILIAVTIIFTYSYVTNNQSIKASQASTALDKMVNTADLVYALGPDNNQFVWVTFPMDLQAIQDITVCEDTQQQGHNQDCTGHGGVKLGAIELQLSLLNGVSNIRSPAKAEIELDLYNGAAPVNDRQLDPVDPDKGPREGRHKIKVYWCENRPNNLSICLKRA